MAGRQASAESVQTLPVGGSVRNERGKAWAGQVKGSFLKPFAENFLYAGSSAFFLLVANLFPNYWYLSFFALIPFIWRIIRLDALGALQLGLLFGFSFFSIYKLPDALTIALGTVLFALFGWVVARQEKNSASTRFSLRCFGFCLNWV
jgi:hypothetical protein